ncbi:MAG TPA: hypothetical protein DIS94_10190 [Bacteroidetes bacterium]|nr:hypothetical protein [Bacteroidota bacterium]
MNNSAIKILFFFFILIIFANTAHTQIKREWVRSYKIPGSGVTPDDMALDSSGNIYVCGFGNNGIITIKYSPSGNKIWERLYTSGEPIAVQPVKMAIDLQKNIYIIGHTLNWHLVKYDSSGNFQWRSRYSGPGPGSSYPRDMVLDTIGNIYITGFSGGIGTFLDITTAKYNPQGDTVWTRRFDYDNYNDDGIKILLNNDNHIYVFGHMNFSTTSIRRNLVLLKYSISGEQIFDKYVSVPENYFDYPIDMKNDKEGNILLLCNRNLPRTITMLYKYNILGDTLWNYFYSGYNNNAYPSKVTTDSVNNIYIIGGNINDSNRSELYINKLFPNGSIDFEKNYGILGKGIGCTDALISNNKILYTGSIGSSSPISNSKFISLESDLAAKIKWYETFDNGNLVTNFGAIRILSFDNSFYVFGSGTGNIDSNFTLFLIKYNLLSNINNGSEIVKEFKLHQNYPNPFNPITNIEFRITKYGFVTLNIYDITGKLIETLINKNLSPGSYKIQWDAGNKPTGIYFYSMLSDNKPIDTKRMILIK